MKVSIDQKFSMQLPESFLQLSESELRTMGANMEDEGLVFRDEAAHILLQFFWKKIPLFGGMTSLEKTVETTAQQHKKMVPGYRNFTLLEGVAAGEKAAGFSYEYTVQNIDQITLYYCIRYEKKHYAFLCTMRKERFDGDHSWFEKLLAGAEKE